MSTLIVLECRAQGLGFGRFLLRRYTVLGAQSFTKQVSRSLLYHGGHGEETGTYFA